MSTTLARNELSLTYNTTDEIIAVAETNLAMGKLGESETLCRHVLRENRKNADAIAVLGLIAYRTGNSEQARRMLMRAIEIAPDTANHHFKLGEINYGCRDPEAAVAAYNSALQCDPHSFEVLVNLGNTLLDLKKYNDAEEASHRAIKLVPESAEAHSNLGQAYLKQGRYAEALHVLNKSTVLAPQRSDLLNNFGVIQQLIGDVDGAISSFQAALKMDPLALLAERNLKIAVLNSPSWSAKALFSLHVNLAKRHDKHSIQGRFSYRHDVLANRKLRVGYVSSDFHDHPVGNNILPLLRNHNKDNVELVLYSNVEEPDQKTDIFKNTADNWRDVTALNDKQLAHQIKADCIDIAVYLAGRFNKNRVESAAFRPAPIQVSYHDCATTGLKAMDYWFTDSVLHPLETEEQFTEELYRLPVFYQFELPELMPVVSAPPCLKNGYVTFGSFNKPEKLSSETISLWAAILRQTKDSKLVLKHGNLFGDGEINTIWRDRFAHEGIDEDRLLLKAGEHSRSEHLALYSQIDISLDPFPFNGSTTSFESLLMGVPVITLEGRRFVDRVGATLLKQCSLGEFVAADKDAYVNTAIRLANAPLQISAWREKTRSYLLGSPLCENQSYAASVESAYKDMWQRKSGELRQPNQ